MIKTLFLEDIVLGVTDQTLFPIEKLNKNNNDAKCSSYNCMWCVNKAAINFGRMSYAV